MLRTINTSLLALLLTLGSPALAQDSTTETDSEAAEESSGIESQLDLGEEVTSPGVVGQYYVKEDVGDFQMKCFRTETGEDPCELYQLIQDENEVPLAEFSLYRLPDGGRAVAGTTVSVPLEVALRFPLTIAVDGGPAKKYQYTFCNQIACFVQIGLTAEDVAAYRRGASATISMVPMVARDQTVKLTLSLKGFTAGFDKASVLVQN